MRSLQSWWQTLVWSSRYNPPQIVEAVMLALSLVALGLWILRQEWQYLALNVSYIVGTISLMLAREAIAPSARTWVNRSIALALLFVLFAALGAYCFITTH